MHLKQIDDMANRAEAAHQMGKKAVVFAAVDQDKEALKRELGDIRPHNRKKAKRDPRRKSRKAA